MGSDKEKLEELIERQRRDEIEKSYQPIKDNLDDNDPPQEGNKNTHN